MPARISIYYLAILSLLAYLSGCNSTAGNHANGSSSGKIESRNISASQIASDDANTSYQGSQAYNSSLYSGEDVNGQTGTLSLARSLISSPGISKGIDLNLNLVYSSSGAKTVGALGLVNGWDLQLSKVTATNSVNIDGSNYAIDKTWVDESGYQSGLKYINNNAIKFSSYSIDKSLNSCHTPNGGGSIMYHSIYQGANGSHQYFDDNGNLVARDDKDGNCISYSYIGGKLHTIVDSYGVAYTLSISDNVLTVTSATSLGNRVIKVSIGRQGVTSYTDASGYVTTYGYDNNGLVNKITSPSLLVTNISYTTLPYTSCSNGGGTLYAVNNLTHNSANKVVLNSTTYKYGVATNGANFTGFGLGGGICLSNKNDGLAETNNPNLKYDVTVIKNGSNNAPSQISRVYYNFIHLPVEQDNLASDTFGATILSKVNYSYNISPGSSKRSASFSSPIEKSIYQGNVEVEKTNTSYDKYNQVTSSTDTILMNGVLTPFQNTVTHYFDGDSYYLVSDTTTTDLISQETKKEHNTLTADGHHIAQTDTFYKGNAWKTLNYGYDNNGRITTNTMSWSGSVPTGSAKSSTINDSYSYSNGILTDKQTDALNHTTTIVKDTTLPGAPIISKTDPNGNVTTYKYDIGGRQKQVITPLGNSTTMSYSVASSGGSNTVTTTDALNHATTVRYNELGQVMLVSDNGDTGNNKSRTIQSNTYYPNGSLQTTTDKLGNTTSYTYDNLGRQLTSTDSLGNIMSTTYDDASLTKRVFLNGNKLSSETTDGIGNTVTSISYSIPTVADNEDHIIEVHNSYNGLKEKLISTTIAGGSLIKQTNNTYNGDGDIEVANDNLSNPSSSSGSSINSSYNDNSQVDSSSIKDLLGKPLTINTLVNGDTTNNSYTNEYDATGLLKTSKNTMGTKTMTYYPNGSIKTLLTNYDNTTTEYSYDADGNEISQTKAGVTITKGYDANHNLTSISNSGTPKSSNVHYKYTNTNLLTNVIYPDGKSVTYTYYDNGLLKSKTNALGVTTNYVEDSQGRIESMSTLGSTIRYRYDDIKQNAGKKGMLKSTTLTNSSGTKTIHTYTYDGFGGIASDTTNEAGNTTTVTYQKDAQQRTIGETITSKHASKNLNLTKTYQYDSMSRLKQSTTVYANSNESVTEVYSYDKDGNIKSYTTNESTINYTYNDKDQLILVNMESVSYDNAGNMTHDDKGNIYSYNSQNQLVSVRDSHNQLLSSYDYYADGLLKTKQAQDNSTLNFYYDNGHIDGIKSSKLSSTNFMLNNRGSVIASFDSNGSNSYLTAGNSTIGMFDESGGVSNSYSYTGYGSIMNEDATTSPSKSLLWDGEYNDTDTGLVYLRARFYSPTLMRFINADTVNVANLYNFGNGDPIDNLDPSGHIPAWADYLANSVAIAIGVGAMMWSGGASLAALGLIEGGAASAAGEVAISGEAASEVTTASASAASSASNASAVATRSVANIADFSEPVSNEIDSSIAASRRYAKLGKLGGALGAISGVAGIASKAYNCTMCSNISIIAGIGGVVVDLPSVFFAASSFIIRSRAARGIVDLLEEAIHEPNYDNVQNFSAAARRRGWNIGEINTDADAVSRDYYNDTEHGYAIPTQEWGYARRNPAIEFYRTGANMLRGRNFPEIYRF